MRARKKLGLSLAAVNLTGLLLGISFSLISNILTGIIGFLIGLIGSSALIYLKNSSK